MLCKILVKENLNPIIFDKIHLFNKLEMYNRKIILQSQYPN